MKPSLYSIIEEKHLAEILETFHLCLDISVQALDEHGEPLLTFGKTHNYCQVFRENLPSGESCQTFHSRASQLAMGLGETYIFCCPSNLYHIVFPLVKGNALLGSILAGPFLMDTPDVLITEGPSKKYNIPASQKLILLEEARQVPIIEPSRVTHISRMLYYMFSGLVTDSTQQFKLNQSKLYQQSEINESIQLYKTKEPRSITYPYEKEKELINKLKIGDTDRSKALLNELLGYVFFAEGNNFNVMRTRAVELVSLLSRAAIEGGATGDSVLKANNQVVLGLQQAGDIHELCYLLQDSIDVFTDCMFSLMPSRGNEIIRTAIRYISKHYATDLTLTEVAEEVHLTPSYFSSLFKQSTGSSFKEYLNMIRIEESKRLLIGSTASISEISQACGFQDQSYFTKTFKKYTGLTPREYR